MAIPKSFEGRLKLPVIAAPMFLVSGPQLVIETCKAGAVGTFPALNQRTTEGFSEWLTEIKSALDERSAPYGVNLIVHNSNPRIKDDVKMCMKHKVPLVITSLGAVKDVVQAIHSYGGLVFHDVTNLKHAKKAAEAGVDGIIAVCAGAGGHAGTMSPFSLIKEIRDFFKGTIVLAGAITDGTQVAAAEMIGADLAYMGTRFINTKESLADANYKKMIIDSQAMDILYTPAVSGIPANFMLPSLVANGFDPKDMKAHGDLSKISLSDEAKAWKNIWSAGHGVSNIHDVPATGELVARLQSEYKQAWSQKRPQWF